MLKINILKKEMNTIIYLQFVNVVIYNLKIIIFQIKTFRLVFQHNILSLNIHLLKFHIGFYF